MSAADSVGPEDAVVAGSGPRTVAQLVSESQALNRLLDAHQLAEVVAVDNHAASGGAAFDTRELYRECERSRAALADVFGGGA